MSKKDDIDREKYWYKYAEEMLLNKKIISVVWQQWDPDDEDSQTGLVFETEDNVAFFLSSDDEGNDPGALHWSSIKPIGPHKDTNGILPVGIMAYSKYLKEL